MVLEEKEIELTEEEIIELRTEHEARMKLLDKASYESREFNYLKGEVLINDVEDFRENIRIATSRPW
jgi:hypothetical protein